MNTNKLEGMGAYGPLLLAPAKWELMKISKGKSIDI